MRVVVSFSTIPSRISHLHHIFNVIKNQTYPIDKIYINLPYYSTREQCCYPTIPSDIDLTNVQIIKCNDYGPITKLYPVLDYENDPNTIIITFDDDVDYLSTTVSTLVKWCQQYPNAAISGSGYIVGNWYNFFGHISNPKQITSVGVIEGFAGCAYRRKFFDKNIIDYSGAPVESYYHDDLWISGYLSLRSIDRLVYPDSFKKNTQRDRLPNGLSDNKFTFIKKFYPTIKYFKNQGVFNENQIAPWYDILGIKIILIIILIIVIFTLFLTK